MKRIISGIYCIKNLINNKCYIGQSSNLSYRKRIHFYELKKNKHVNKHLQNAYNKYGENNFLFEIIIVCEISELTYYEREIIKGIKKSQLYNIKKECSDTTLGFNHSKKSKKLMSKKAKEYYKTHRGNAVGRKASEEEIEMNRIRNLGKKITEEQLEKHLQNTPRGSNCYSSKLTEDDVKEIKKMIDDGLSNFEIVKIFFVSPSCIWKIRTGKSWKHIL